MAKTTNSTGVYGIDANKKVILKDPPKKKRNPKFSAGAELKNAVK